MERIIKYSQFRNIGLDEPQTLILNSDFAKGKMGNLIIVIGSNNSGKSNVLDGILKLHPNEGMKNRDVTTLYYDDAHKHPEITLSYRDKNDDYEFKYTKSLQSNGKWSVYGLKESKAPSKTITKKELNILKQDLASVGRSISEIDYFIRDLDLEMDIETYNQRLSNIIGMAQRSCNQYYPNNWNSIKPHFNTLYNYYLEITGDSTERLKAMFKQMTGVEALPTIHNYVEQKLTGNELILNNISDIKNNKFFKSLFKAIDEDPQIVLNAYKTYNEHRNIAILKKLEEELAPKIEKLNDQFNRMYFASKDKYKFTLVLDSSQISFGMARGRSNDAIMLEYQSVGFRWFFNLFFNFLSSNVLNPGDIVIMDEPATNLHPEGQIELRNFIKDFAIKNDILFVIATQSPFLIDPDCLDELRVVSMENNRSSIDNLYTAINKDDPDSLLPIKRSLTIKQNVIYDFDTEVVWIEGITDYNYLTMFKKLLNIKNIAFLPFKGVGNTPEATKQILRRLLEVKLYKRSLLVDGDKAGCNMYEEASKTDFKNRVYKISDLSTEENKYMMIEDLFSKEDKKKFGVIALKSGLGSADLKTHAKLKDFSDETIENFKKLFDLIQDS